MTPHGNGLEDASMFCGRTDMGYSASADSRHLQAAKDTVLGACYALGGDMMATASDTGAIQVWAARQEQDRWCLLHTEQLPSMDNQPTQLAWAHPQHGQLLAVGTRNGCVHIIQGHGPTSSHSSSHAGQQKQARATELQRQGAGSWACTERLQCGKGPVSALAFAPHQHGLVLAAACSRQQFSAGAGSGYVLLWESAGQPSSCVDWTLVSKLQLLEAAGSCRCLCWHDPTPGLPPLLLGGHADGGSIWGYNSPTMMWQELASFSAPGGIGPSVLSVHWAPALGRPFEVIAASFGSTVVLYKVQQARSSSPSAGLEQQRQLGQLEVVPLQQLSHPMPVWKLEFSMMGNTLACSLDGRPEVWLWMPMMDGAWAAVSKIESQQQDSSSGRAVVDEGLMVD